MSRTHKVHTWSLAAVCALMFVFSASAEQVLRAVAQAVTSAPDTLSQDPPPPPVQEPPAQPGRGGGRGTQPREYNTVVTKDAKTDEGIFKVHRISTPTEQVLYEIPKNELDKDFLWTVQIKRTTLGTGFGGREAQSRVVRWVKRGDRILLQDINFSTYADPSDPVAQAVADANYPAIIRTLPVLAYSPSGDAVVDVTTFFTTDSIPEFSARAAVPGAGNPDPLRTFLEKVVSYPENINAETTMTFTGGGGAAAAGGGGGRAAGGGMRGSSGTVVVAHSMVKLPERAMMSRPYDDRVGYVNQTQTDFGTAEHRSVTKRFIHRFKLEKKDASAAVSDPVKPIVFYIDPATPAKFIPYVKRGVESWQAAFEAAGFRNAIQAKDAPKDDEFSMEDARYSVVRWSPSNGEEMTNLHDPRSGEIISADVRAFPNVQTFGASWYLVQAGPLDKRAQQLPLPDDVTGELIRSMVAHQVGHSLGLVHNLKASSMYSVAQVRDPKFVKENGYSASIMDDSGFNYVAQPEDGMDPADLFPKIGPYDKFAIAWGYRPVPGARTPDAEKTMLDQWAREQDSKPFLRFSTDPNNSADPGESPETPDTAAVQLPGPVGDADAVASSTLGLKNLERVSAMLMKATGSKVGDPWDDLEEVYGRMASLWSVEMSPVVRVIGGVDSQQLHIGQEGVKYKTVPKARQTAALDFLMTNAFKTPAFMVRPDVLRRIQPMGAIDRVRTAQTTVLTALLQNQRIDRMTEQALLDQAIAYSPLQFLTDVRNGIWSELGKPGASVDLYRRNLQRAYLLNLDQKLNGTPSSSAEIRALVKGELRALDRQLQTASAAAGADEPTRRHITDSREEIKIILDPRVPRPAPDPAAAPAAAGRGRGANSGFAALQDPPDPGRGAGGGRQGGGGQGGGQVQAPRPYEQVVTKSAQTSDGVFKVHRITTPANDQLLYEIPKKELDKDFLINSQIKRNAAGSGGYGGAQIGTRVVRWSLKGDRVLLLNMDYTTTADPSNPLLMNANVPAIIRTFPVAAYAASGDPVIDVTALYTTDIAEMSGRGGGGGGRGMDPNRTFLEKVVAFPININVEVTQTSAAGGGGGAAAPAPAPGGGRGAGGGASTTILVSHSMVKLPEKAMMPRLFDERVGYFTQGVTDYETGERQAMQKRFITRYRLEKKDPNAAMSEPVKPITYYVDPSTPKKWVPYVKKGIEVWQKAFEAAGFKNGIVAKEAPADDPNWSAEDARYSVIRYLPSTTENAVGPHVHDPRSGEIINADVQYYHNVMNLAKNWYFVQAGPLDPRAQTLPLPDDLMGTLIQYVVAHEVGHTLGFQHNMKASSQFTIEQIRDPKWVKEHGHTPTLMDYSRFNYVAQPEDKIDVNDLVPKIGPYDIWATMWGYAPIPGAKTPEEEKPTLDKWAREQDQKPYLRFSTEGQGGTDPGDNTEAVGDADAVKATTLGIKNLSRVSEMLLKATTTRTGDPYTELNEVYGRMVGQWSTEMGHVVRVIGGMDSKQQHIGQEGVRFVTVPKARQQEALKFILDNAFQTPSFMIRPEILRKIQASGVVTRIQGLQSGIMGQLLQAARLDRMAEQLIIDGPAIAYSPLQFLTDLRAGVWSELAKPGTTITIFRRNLQRAYLDQMDGRLNGSEGSTEVRSLVRGELAALDRQLQAALPGATDEMTRRHLQDCRDEIATTLDPLVPRPAGGAGGGRGGGRGGGFGR